MAERFEPRVLVELRRAMGRARKQQADDTDHPSFCVVSNSVVNDLLSELDKVMPLVEFVNENDMALRGGMSRESQWWRARAKRNRDAWEAGEADPAVAAAQDAEVAMSHEQYRLNAEACDRHADAAQQVAADLFRLLNKLER